MKGQRSAPPLISPELERQSRPGQRRFRCQGERQLSDESERDRPGRTFHPRLCAAPLSARRRHPSLPPTTAPPLRVEQLKPNAVILSPPRPLFLPLTYFFPTPPKPNSASEFHSASRADRGSSLQDGTSSVQHHELTRAPTHARTHTNTYGTHCGGAGDGYWHVLAAANPAGTFGGF